MFGHGKSIERHYYYYYYKVRKYKRAHTSNRNKAIVDEKTISLFESLDTIHFTDLQCNALAEIEIFCFTLYAAEKECNLMFEFAILISIVIMF